MSLIFRVCIKWSLQYGISIVKSIFRVSLILSIPSLESLERCKCQDVRICLSTYPSNVLLNAKEEEMSQYIDHRLARAIIMNREEKLKVKPGYDGEYGVPVFPDNLKLGKATKQKALGDF